MIRAALFDLDGTLQDSEILWVYATRDYVRTLGLDLTDDEAVQLVYGHSWRQIYETIVRLVPGCGLGLSEMADLVRDHFVRLSSERDIAIPGSVALLRRLAAEMPVAIVSGSVHADIAIAADKLKIGDLLRFFLGGDEYGQGKPAPDCYLEAARRIGVPPAECVVFEDSTAGIRAAKAAGMWCVALNIAGRPAQQLDLADLVLPDLSAFDPKTLATQ
jgi:HAD superfamily hydrolase (TIGR01509 family)